MADFTGKLEDAAAVRNYVLAGNATTTIRSVATGTRFTYRVRVKNHRLPEGAPAPTGPWWVEVLTGDDNTSAYSYLGTILSPDRFAYNARRATISADAPSVRAFTWLWKQIAANALPATVEVWHEGRCGRCNRKLTVPESIATGLGPICAGRTNYGVAA